MADQQVYFESIGGISPTKFAFNRHGGGKSVYTLLIGNDGTNVNDDVADAQQIHDAITEILGSTHTHEDGLRLQRNLPKADPISNWLFAEEIAEISGRGQMVKTPSGNNNQPESTPLDSFALYQCYQFNVSFTPRPYILVGDDKIKTDTLKWATLGGDVINVRYAEEWKRYVDIERLPASEYITAQLGQFQINVASGESPDGCPGISGQLRMLIQKEGIKITWYEVPYSYIDPRLDSTEDAYPSYISQALGCVNQYDWNGFPKGTLLLEAVGVSRYSPPIPNTYLWEGDTEIFGNNKLCDIVFICLFIDPPLGKDAEGNPADPDEPPAPFSGDAAAQIVQQGHNRVPYAHTMEWYYAETSNTNLANADGRPIYPSFPFELMFTNPGATD